MGNPSNEFLEKAAVLGLAVPAGLAAGNMASNVMEHGYLSKEAKDRAEKEQSIRDKDEDAKRKQEPSGGDNRVTGAAKAMKKGGSVKSASARADGCAIRGKTRA